MARKLEVIIKESIDVNRIAKAIRAGGYRTKTEKSKEAIVLSGDFLSKLHNKDRFEKLEDGWVRDNLLGLDWGKSSEDRMNWTKAKEYAQKEGGRLPEVNELHSLVDYSKHYPAIDTNFFSDTKTDDYYWTGTPVASCSVDAWFVRFYYGNVYYYNKGYYYYVRCVRSCQ
jgi:hypothetical protein